MELLELIINRTRHNRFFFLALITEVSVEKLRYHKQLLHYFRYMKKEIMIFNCRKNLWIKHTEPFNTWFYSSPRDKDTSVTVCYV